MLINPGYPFTREMMRILNSRCTSVPTKHKHKESRKPHAHRTRSYQRPEKTPGRQAENALLSNLPLRMSPWEEQGRKALPPLKSQSKDGIFTLPTNPCHLMRGWHNCSKYCVTLPKKNNLGYRWLKILDCSASSNFLEFLLKFPNIIISTL